MTCTVVTGPASGRGVEGFLTKELSTFGVLCRVGLGFWLQYFLIQDCVHW